MTEMADWEDRAQMFTIGKVGGGERLAASGGMRQEYGPHKGLGIRVNKHKEDSWTKENQRELDIIKDNAILEPLAATEERTQKARRERRQAGEKTVWS